MDGRMYEVEKDYLEQSPMNMVEASRKTKQARARLQSVLDEYPEWEPDNSTFNDENSKEFQKFLDLQADLEK